jgi:hypothetical protein
MRLPAVGPPTPCLAIRYVYSRLELSLDGELVRGQVHLRYELDEGDSVAVSEADGTIEGPADHEPPSLSVGLADPPLLGGGVSPMGQLRIIANKPVRRPATVALVASDGTRTLLTPAGQDAEAAIAFTSARGPARFGVTAQLSVSPSLTDLAGDVGAAALSVTTAPDPGLLSFDGFEGPVAAAGNAALLFNDQLGLPAIAGQRSLALVSMDENDDTVVMRLPVSSPGASVHFSFRRAAPPPGAFAGQLGVRLAAPGGAPTSQAFPLWTFGEADQLVSTPRGQWSLGPVRDVALPLPAGTDKEVLLEFRLSAQGCVVLPDEATPWVLVDGVRVD